MIALSMVANNPRVSFWLVLLAAAFLGALLSVSIQRGFIWPRVFDRRINEFSNGEMLERDLEIKALRNELVHQAKIIEAQGVKIRGAAAMLAGSEHGKA